MADLELQTAIQKVPVKKLRTKKRARTFSTIKINEIYTAFITWPSGGKRRPILIVHIDNDSFAFFKLRAVIKTSLNESKLITIRFKIGNQRA